MITSWILCAARCSVTAPLEDDHDTNTLTLTAAPPRQCVQVNSEHVYGRSWDRFVLTVKEFKEFSCWLENKGDIFWVFLFFFRTKSDKNTIDYFMASEIDETPDNDLKSSSSLEMCFYAR